MERRYEVFVIMDSVIWNLIMSMQRSLMKKKAKEEDKKKSCLIMFVILDEVADFNDGRF